MSENKIYRVVVLISANQEWQALKAMTTGVAIQTSPYGEYFVGQVDVDGLRVVRRFDTPVKGIRDLSHKGESSATVFHHAIIVTWLTGTGKRIPDMELI